MKYVKRAYLFLVFGILIAIVNKTGVKRGEEKRKRYSCDGCPSRSLCKRTSCGEVSELVADEPHESKEV